MDSQANGRTAEGGEVGMSEFITRVGGDEYQVIFKTDSVEKYHAVEDFCREIIDHGKPSGWTSVKDRLPAKNKPVLWFVTLKDRGMGHIRLGTFEGTVNHEIPEVSCCGPNAIPLYWMPLPEPPKEG